MIGIYIHIPFCSTKCPYCDFYSCNFSMKAAENYKASVIRNINAYPVLKADTIYFGGGTPSLLPPLMIEEILTALREHFDLHEPEITLEVNPCTVNLQKLTELKEMGINRLSVGVQSAIDSELVFLGRKHTFSKAEEIITAAFEIGFNNISCDMMIGLPNQNKDMIDETIGRYSQLPIQHISSYILKIEENTPFAKNFVDKLIPDDDKTAELYLHMVNKMEEYGFMQYEISNFCKPGFESRHNLKYWNCKEYIGFGPSAHSFFGGKRYAVPNDLELFINSPTQTEEITDENAGQTDERIMLGLRLNQGVNINDYPDEKGYIEKKIPSLEKAGLVSFDSDVLKLTPKGFLVSNAVICELIM